MLQKEPFNPIYPDVSAAELQPVPDHFYKINLSA